MNLLPGFRCIRMKLTPLVLSLVSATMIAGLTHPARGQVGWPDRPVKIVVPFPPGGSNDVLARAVAPGLQSRFGQPFVVDNKPGAGGNIGAEYVARSPADGYTLLQMQNGITMMPWLTQNLSFDPMQFSPVMIAITLPMVVTVNNDLPVKSIADLISHAKANSGRLSYATPGVGTPHHLATELFMNMTGTKMVMIPYKGTAAIALDLMAGRVNVLFSALDTMRPHILAGKIRAIAIAERRRLSQFPDLPTVAETVPDFEVYFWLGFVAPPGTPEGITRKLAAELKVVLAMPDIHERLTRAGFTINPGSPSEMAAIMKADYEKWGKVVRAAGIKGE